MNRSIAIVDCNNFYVSCEQLFNPKLKNKPVVVLSNNDGCIVARSEEAKALGVRMGEPWFQIKTLAKKYNIITCSSNYALYSDMSDRVMSILSKFSPNQEIYSIDECFLDFTGFCKDDLTIYAQKICNCIQQQTGLPVCIGIGSSKTLAKLANHIAKKNSSFQNVCNFNTMTIQKQNKLLNKINTKDIWGIGKQLSIKLQKTGIYTAFDLKNINLRTINLQSSVYLRKIIYELNNIACSKLKGTAVPKKKIICSRSFSTTITDFQDLEQSITLYVSHAAEKLRQQNSYTGSIHIYISTSPFNKEESYYTNSTTIPLPEQTDNTLVLTQFASFGLRKIYCNGYKYQKAGILLSKIVPRKKYQAGLFNKKEKQEKSDNLMTILDKINAKMGRKILVVASEGITQPWKMRQNNKSLNYTTSWHDLIVANQFI
tara:strand:+ start:82 stop:1368 length:1287 start_codon:yes stop_codon:yes gene_type:complete